MEPLSLTLQSIPNWETMSPEALRDELIRVRTEPNPRPYTMVAIGETLGPAIRSLVNFSMMRIALGEVALPTGMEPVRADIDSARVAMSATSGLSLHTPERQQLIALIGVVCGWTPEQIATVQSLGVRSYTLADPSITVGDVEGALQMIQVESVRASMREDARRRYNAHMIAIDAYNGDGDPPVL